MNLATTFVFFITSGHTTAEVFQEALVRMNRFAQGNPAPFIAKVYKSGKVRAWKSRTQLLKLLKIGLGERLRVSHYGSAQRHGKG